MIDLRCSLCGHILAKDFEGHTIALKCHRHPPGGKIIRFEVVQGELRSTVLNPTYLTGNPVHAIALDN